MTSCVSFHHDLSAAIVAKTAASWRNVLKATQRLLAHIPPCIWHTPPPYVQTHNQTVAQCAVAHYTASQNKLSAWVSIWKTHFLYEYPCTYRSGDYSNKIHLLKYIGSLQFWGTSTGLLFFLFSFVYTGSTLINRTSSPLHSPLHTLQIYNNISSLSCENCDSKISTFHVQERALFLALWQYYQFSDFVMVYSINIKWNK